GCCARAGRGHVTAPAPSKPMNSRLSIWPARTRLVQFPESLAVFIPATRSGSWARRCARLTQLGRGPLNSAFGEGSSMSARVALGVVLAIGGGAAALIPLQPPGWIVVLLGSVVF